MRASGLVEGMDVGSLPPFTGSPRTDLKQTSNSSLGREWYRVTNKPFPTSAVSNWPQNSKQQRIHTNRWEGGLLGPTPLYSLSQELLDPTEASFLLLTESESPLYARRGGGQGKFLKLASSAAAGKDL